MSTKKSNVKNTNSKAVKGKKGKKVTAASRKRAPKGNTGATNSEAQELKTNGKTRSRKPTDDTKKKTRVKKSDNDKPLFNIFEVTLPDKTKVQRRFAVGKEIKGNLMVKLAEDNKWYVLLWASKGDKLEKRAEIIANRHINKDSPRFKSLLYTEIRVGRDNIRVVEKNTRGKVELVEDRTVFNKIRKVEGSDKPAKKTESTEVKVKSTEVKKTSSKKKKTSSSKKKAAKKPVA